MTAEVDSGGAVAGLARRRTFRARTGLSLASLPESG